MVIAVKSRRVAGMEPVRLYDESWLETKTDEKVMGFECN